MAEVVEESTHVWSSQPRIALFLAAMRHFARALEAAGRPLRYVRLDQENNRGTLAAELEAEIERTKPERRVKTAPRRLASMAVDRVGRGASVPSRCERVATSTRRAEVRSTGEGRKTLRLEYFYRELRHRFGVLMEHGEPIRGRWSYDAVNREPFGREGPRDVRARTAFEPDDLTREVIALVRARFGEHPGSLESFAWPVTREHALVALRRRTTSSD